HSKANGRWCAGMRPLRRGRPNCCRRQAPMWTAAAMRPAKSCARSPPTWARFRSRRAPGTPVISQAPPLRSAPRPVVPERDGGAGIPANVIDKPRLCDFIFGAIVNRSPLVIGISTDGAAPVFAQAIRAKIEGLLPRGFARWAEAARRWRTLVQATDLPFAARR